MRLVCALPVAILCPPPYPARHHTLPAAIPCPPRLREAPRARLSWA